MKQKKLLLAGSHAGATAFSLVREIIQRRLSWKIFWIGKKWATEEKKSFTLEYNSLPKLGVDFYPLESGKIQTKFTRHTIPALFKVPLGFLIAGYYLAKIRPDLILTFGGAAGAEVSFWGWIFGVPLVVHEQTTSVGRANLFASKFAKVVALSRDSSKAFFRNKKVVVTGNPINPAISKLVSSSPKKGVKTIFITGGSRGSQRINEAVSKILPKLLARYRVIHQVGEGNVSKYQLSTVNYQVFGQIASDKWPKVLSDTDIVVARAGANIVSELIVLRKPCILIPIPWTYMDEQTKNAQYAKGLGIARIIPQSELSAERLLAEIEEAIADYPKTAEKIKKIVSPDIDASKKLVDLLEKEI